MKWLFIIIFALSAQAAESKPGLLVKATDGELTVYFVAPSPDFAVQAKESIHPQLKPAFRAEWSGYLQIENAGEYVIYGPTNLSIDGKFCAGQKVTLPTGQRAFRMSMARKKNETARARLEWEFGDSGRQPIPASAFFHGREPRELRENQERDSGRELFETFSCGACHQETPMKYGALAEVTNAAPAKAMADLQPTQGCLSENPEAPAQNFNLTRAQREALQIFVQVPDISPSPAIDFARQFRQLRCGECHNEEFTMPPAQFNAFVTNHHDRETLFPAKSEEMVFELMRNYLRVRGE
jgi:hypothetical protein